MDPVPPGYTAVTPWVVSRSTDRLLAFTRDVLAFDARPGWPATPAFLRLYAADGDELFGRALAAVRAADATPRAARTPGA